MANAIHTDSANTGTSKALAFTPTAGRLLVCHLGTTAAVTTVSGGVQGGGNWTQFGADITGRNLEHIGSFWCIAAGGATTVTWGQTAGEFLCAEYALAPGVADGGTTAANGSGTAIAVSNLVAVGVDILFALTMCNSGTPAFTKFPWVFDVEIVNNERATISSLITGPGTYTIDTTGTYTNWDARIAGIYLSAQVVSAGLKTIGQGRPPRAFRPGIGR